jgi:hemerythrin-like domain-containing protein
MIKEMLGIAEGILQDLHNDHSEVDTLLGNIMDSENGAERARLFSEMKSKLLPHLEAEQEVLYQRLEVGKSEESRKYGIEGTSEHSIAERQVEKISGLSNPMSDEWTAELKVLQDLIEHHVGEEENTGFSCARDEFTKEQLEVMSRQFKARKAQLATSRVA